MNLAELKAQHPDVYKAAKDEGIAEGLAQGQKAGFEAGKKEGLVEGATAECARIKDIESLMAPGAEAIVNTMKFDASKSKGDVAIAIVQENAKVLKNARESLAAEGAAVADALKGVGTQPPAAAGAVAGDVEVDAAIATLKALRKR